MCFARCTMRTGKRHARRVSSHGRWRVATRILRRCVVYSRHLPSPVRVASQGPSTPFCPGDRHHDRWLARNPRTPSWWRCWGVHPFRNSGRWGFPVLSPSGGNRCLGRVPTCSRQGWLTPMPAVSFMSLHTSKKYCRRLGVVLRWFHMVRPGRAWPGGARRGMARAKGLVEQSIGPFHLRPLAGP